MSWDAPWETPRGPAVLQQLHEIGITVILHLLKGKLRHRAIQGLILDREPVLIHQMCGRGELPGRWSTWSLSFHSGMPSQKGSGVVLEELFQVGVSSEAGRG
jgi:hypothetical protein